MPYHNSILDYKQISKHRESSKMIVNDILAQPAHQIVITIEASIYKIHQKEYNDREKNLTFFLYSLVTLMLVTNAYNVSILTSQIRVVAIYLIVVQLPIGVFIFRQRKQMPVIVLNYMILIFIQMTCLVIPQEKIYISAAIYAIIVFIGNLIMLNDRKAIVLILFGLVQIVLLQLKVSGIITDDWNLVLMPLTATQVCLFIAVTMILIMMLLQACSNEQTRKPLWKYNLGIKLMIGTTFFMQFLLPLAIIYIHNKLILIIITGCIEVHHLIAILFIVFRRQHIICSFASPTQQVSILQQSQQHSAFEKTIHRVSSHWFSLEETINPANIKQPLPLKQVDCLICLSETASMIWVPCGHLNACEKCATFMMKNGKFNCLLCKKQAKHLLKVDVEKPLLHQQYAIQKEISIMRAPVFR